MCDKVGCRVAFLSAISSRHLFDGSRLKEVGERLLHDVSPQEPQGETAQALLGRPASTASQPPLPNTGDGDVEVPLHGASLALLLAASGLAQPLTAQSLGDRLKRKVAEKVDKKTNDGLDKVASCVVGDAACVEKAKKEGKTVTMTDKEGKPVAAEAVSTESAAGGAAAENLKPGEGAWANYDFVPGERVVFAEDFSKDRVGNFPKRFELLDGNMEIVEWQGKRWLRVSTEGEFSIALPETLPERFTVEFDLTIPWSGMSIYAHENVSGASGEGRPQRRHRGGERRRCVPRPEQGRVHRRPAHAHQGLFGEHYAGGWLTPPYRVRVQADGRYMKVYLNEHRVSNIPNADFARTKTLTFHFQNNSWNAEQASPLHREHLDQRRWQGTVRRAGRRWPGGDAGDPLRLGFGPDQAAEHPDARGDHGHAEGAFRT